jgi:hypothetical protein
VIWNNVLGELWRRTVPVYLPRMLARQIDVTQAHLRELVGVGYVKVAEYQRRGLVHLHAVIRLDRAMPDYRTDQLRPPDQRFTTSLLEDAVRATVAEVSAPIPDELGGGRVRWGDQLDIRPLDPNTRREVAGYLAKYATKSTEQAGSVPHRITEHQIDRLPVRQHVRAYMRQAFRLHAQPALRERRFGPCAHALGYRGHCLTKSRRYSTTFKALRQAREQHVHQRLAASGDESQRALAEIEPVHRIKSFTYAGRGHLTTADAFLAASAAARAREARRLAREEWLMDDRAGSTSREEGRR